MYIQTLLLHIKVKKYTIFQETTHDFRTRSRLKFEFSLSEVNSTVEVGNSFHSAHFVDRNLSSFIEDTACCRTAVYNH